MTLRDLLLKDFWWKLLSLALATLLWVTVSVIYQRETGPLPVPGEELTTKIFAVLPVLAMSSASDVREFKFNPGHVEVSVAGRREQVANLQGKAIRVMVDLTGIESAHDLRKRVEVTTPPGFTLVRVTPSQVEVVVPPRPSAAQKENTP